jgi:hypothetical protein
MNRVTLEVRRTQSERAADPQAALEAQSLEGGGHIVAAEDLAGVDGQALTREQVDHRLLGRGPTTNGSLKRERYRGAALSMSRPHFAEYARWTT